MKHLFILLMSCLLLPYSVKGQNSSTKEKPFWTNGVFYEATHSDVKNFNATGGTETQARNNAAIRVIEWKSGATGLRSEVKIENGNVVVKGSDNLTVKARVIDEYYERIGNEYRAHLLVQIAKNPDYDYDYVEPILQKIKKQNSSFFEKNSYFAWGMVNFGFPLTLGTSFAGRHGGVIGVGYYLSVGTDFFPVSYSLGLKVFPHEHLFVSMGYGTLGRKEMKAFNYNDGRWGTDGFRQGKGLTFMVGYDLVVKKGLFLSAGLGISRDAFLRKWEPTINIKVGRAWILNN